MVTVFFYTATIFMTVLPGTYNNNVGNSNSRDVINNNYDNK